MNYLNVGLAIIFIALLGFLLLCSGCAEQSSLILNSSVFGLVQNVNDSNTPVLQATGQAASTLAAQIASNMQTAQGRLAETMKYNSYAYLALVIAFVGGLVFWGFTRSRWGWVIPSASVGGLGLITAFAAYTKYINMGILVLVGAFLIWKAIEYKQERDDNYLKMKEINNNVQSIS